MGFDDATKGVVVMDERLKTHVKSLSNALALMDIYETEQINVSFSRENLIEVINAINTSANEEPPFCEYSELLKINHDLQRRININNHKLLKVLRDSYSIEKGFEYLLKEKMKGITCSNCEYREPCEIIGFDSCMEFMKDHYIRMAKLDGKKSEVDSDHQ